MDHEKYFFFAPSIASTFEGTMCTEAVLPACARVGGAPQKMSANHLGLLIKPGHGRAWIQGYPPDASAQRRPERSEIAERERLQFGSTVTTAVPHTEPAASAGLKNMGVLKSCHQADKQPYPINPPWSSLRDSQIF